MRKIHFTRKYLRFYFLLVFFLFECISIDARPFRCNFIMFCFKCKPDEFETANGHQNGYYIFKLFQSHFLFSISLSLFSQLFSDFNLKVYQLPVLQIKLIFTSTMCTALADGHTINTISI